MGDRDVLEISKFQQVGVVNRKAETNRSNELPTFGEEGEDQKIRENMRIMSISSHPIFSANFPVPTFHHMSVSFPHV